jgi:hypothetical protein
MGIMVGTVVGATIGIATGIGGIGTITAVGERVDWIAD